MQQYQKNTRTVIDYLVTVGRRKGTISIYKACYQSLGDALEQEGVPYSTGFASLWLNQQCNKLEKTAYDLYKAALHKLDDVYERCQVSNGKLYLTNISHERSGLYVLPVTELIN